jgi:hypothetical protein
VKIYVAAVKALGKKEKLVEKLVWFLVVSFCKISFPVTHLMPYYDETDHSHPLIA